VLPPKVERGPNSPPQTRTLRVLRQHQILEIGTPTPSNPQNSRVAIPSDYDAKTFEFITQRLLIIFCIIVLFILGILGFSCSLLLFSIGITYYPSVVQNYLTVLGSYCVLGLATSTISFLVTCLVGFGFILLLDPDTNTKLTKGNVGLMFRPMGGKESFPPVATGLLI
jgi:hypothetical protein